jgi:hypothetical protein
LIMKLAARHTVEPATNFMIDGGLGRVCRRAGGDG